MKIELIGGLEDGNITCYRQGDFVDLCRGPHVETVKACKNFKLLKHSGAYFKGDKDAQVLQRIYGVCFPSAEELEEERRMFYVALTRSKENLFVTYVENDTKKDTVSRFIKECAFTVSK